MINPDKTLFCCECQKPLSGNTAVRFGDNWVCGTCKPVHVDNLADEETRRMVDQGKGILWLGVILTFHVGVMSVISLTAPKFKRMYAEMLAGEPLPWLTSLFCSIPSFGYMIADFIFVSAIVATYFRVESHSARRIMRRFLLLATVVMLIIYLGSIFAPLVRLDSRGLG